MIESALKETVTRWDQAIVSNDVNEISPYMTDDWVIVGADGITSKADFLTPIASGKLTHNRMDSDEMHIKINGDTAVVISKGTSAGTWMGEAFSLFEWSTSTFVRIDGKWLCMVTMLTMVK